MLYRSVSALLVASCILFGCQTEESTPSQSQCVGLDHSHYERGDWPGPTEPKTYGPFPTPDANSSFQRFEFVPALPETINTVWWPSNGEVGVRLKLAAGANFVGWQDATLLLFVDGRQVSMNVGDEVLQVPLQILAGTAGGVEFTVPAATIGPGTHTMAAMIMDVQSGRLSLGKVFTLVREREPFAARPDHTERARMFAAEDFVVPSASRGVLIDRPVSLTTEPDGTLPITLRLQPMQRQGACIGTRTPLVASVLIDGVQASLVGLGPFVRLIVAQKEYGEIDVRVAGIPRDSRPHAVTIVQYEMDGMYTEAPPGTVISGGLPPPQFLGRALVTAPSSP